ncbi:MAG: hypothetical protein ABI678_02675 [Kofleriaceae bacterium]
MTSGLPTRVAICAVLVTAQLATVARADVANPPDPVQEGLATSERRQVAVIDLSEDDKVRALSNALYAMINNSDTLKIPDIRGFDADVTGPLFDEDAQALKDANGYRVQAQTTLDETKAADAEGYARDGKKLLLKVKPTQEIQALLADLAMLEGLADLDQGKLADAQRALALTHRLDPSRQLDPARYPPDTVAAFKRATTAKGPLVFLEIHSEGQVWIDCVERGSAPGTFEGLETGDHIVTVSGSERLTNGAAITLDKSKALPIDTSKADTRTLIQRARLALSRAQLGGDDVARAGAMKRLAQLLGVGDAVMISKRADGQLQWETWRDRAPGFSAPKIYTNQKPEEILEGLGPLHLPRPNFTGPPAFVRPPIVEEQHWYNKGWVPLSLFGAVAVAIVGSILVTRLDSQIVFGSDVKGM